MDHISKFMPCNAPLTLGMQAAFVMAYFCCVMYFLLVLCKAQGTSYHAGYFFTGYGYFLYPDVTGMVYENPET